MESKFSARIAELPGPVWVFGAYVVSRLGEWAFGLLMQYVSGSWRLGGGTALMFLIPAAGVALPVCVLWGLVGRSPYGLSLARWYAGLRVVLHFAALLMLLFSGYDPHLYGGTEMFIRGIARNVVYGALWFLFLLYLERSRAMVAALSRAGAPRGAGCRDVRGALRPASVVRCPDGRGVGAGDVGRAAGALGTGVCVLFCRRSEKARFRVFVWHILGLKLAN